MRANRGISISSPLSGPMIALYAGPDNLPFYVHPNVMSASSDYFRGRFGGSKVPPEHELHLHFPEIDVKDMASFTNYMYRLFWKDYDIQLSTRPNQDLVDHVKLYITGCIFEVPFLLKYVGEVITYLLNKENRAYILSLAPADFAEHLQSRMELVGLVYDNTDEDDMLRTVFVKDMALHSDDYYERGVEHNIDMDFSLREFFRGVPKFSDDLKGFVPRTDEKEEDAGMFFWIPGDFEIDES
ncbi:hypothetical protein Q9L58_007467 [Maublancomyces gigas]|uniref:BTB domain-containing protein n=1 Tax=Discina gigas TaxID=1032678 RepID=A0ABR3GCY5_9PEZI